MEGFRWVIIGMLTLTITAVSLLGFLIPAAVEGNLIKERAEALTRIAADLVERGTMPGPESTETELAAFDELVHLHVLGGDTVRVKLWAPGGELVYSDAPGLQGRIFAPSADITKALGGSIAIGHPDLTRPEDEFERGLGDLLEFYIPIVAQDANGVPMVFEVYQELSPLTSTVATTRRFALLSAGFVLATLTISLLAMMAGRARMLNRRVRSAEDTADDLARAQDEERNRIVGALHDDIGQPLYRVLYGIQGCRAQIGNGPIADELVALEGLIRSIDSTLKTELRLLHADSMIPLVGNELDTLLGELVEQVTRESALDVHLEMREYEALVPALSMTLFRAAREALTNTQKHSGAEHVWVRVSAGNDRVILDVEDDGRGPMVEPGLGLITTRERLEAIGGGITVSSRPGRGTLFRAWAPTGEIIP